MNPEIEIISTDNLAVRAYIKFYFNGIRYREYNGNRIGKEIHPNREKSLEARDKALRTLRLEIQTALENNCFFKPRIVETVKENKPSKQVVPESNSPGVSAREHLSIALQKKYLKEISNRALAIIYELPKMKREITSASKEKPEEQRTYIVYTIILCLAFMALYYYRKRIINS